MVKSKKRVEHRQKLKNCMNEETVLLNRNHNKFTFKLKKIID